MLQTKRLGALLLLFGLALLSCSLSVSGAAEQAATNDDAKDVDAQLAQVAELERGKTTRALQDSNEDNRDIEDALEDELRDEELVDQDNYDDDDAKLEEDSDDANLLDEINGEDGLEEDEDDDDDDRKAEASLAESLGDDDYNDLEQASQGDDEEDDFDISSHKSERNQFGRWFRRIFSRRRVVPKPPKKQVITKVKDAKNAKVAINGGTGTAAPPPAHGSWGTGMQHSSRRRRRRRRRRRSW